MVSEGKTVKVNYTLTVDGEVVDSSREGQPFEFCVGSGQVIPGFERALIGMKQGEKKSFKVYPDEGYGQENPQMVYEVSKDMLPPDPKPELGMTLYARDRNGQSIPARITEVKEGTVVINFNHPLSGKTLDFTAEIVEIN
jgi:FKBP-type peptidyl-prolyl cis-trans isomerase 2